jgi:hypothetical protein
MTENPVAVCPGCAGPFLEQHPAGPFMCQHVGYCPFLVAEEAQKVADLDVPSGTLRPATPVESVLWSAVTGRPHPVPPQALFIRLQPVADGVVHRAPSVWDTHAGKPVREIQE